MTRMPGITHTIERIAIPARVKVDVVIRQRGKSDSFEETTAQEWQMQIVSLTAMSSRHGK
jgi:hypothetical protein